MEQEILQCLQLTLNGTGETAVSTALNGTGQTAVSKAKSQWNRRYCSVYTSLTLEEERLKCLQLTVNGTVETAVSTRH